MKRIGLTGGVGSGKTEVAALFTAAGIAVINLDHLGKELSESDPEIFSQVRAICGEEVVTQGRLDRARVREIIFADAKKRAALENLLHPLIWKVFLDRADAAQRAGEKILICEAALLIETGIYKQLDGLILVTAPEQLRKQRVMERDRVPALLAEKMIRAQLKDAERTKPATIVIENHGSLAALALRVDEIIREASEVDPA